MNESNSDIPETSTTTSDVDSGQQVARSARVIALATIGSRILGSVRDIMTAYYFGAGFLVDAFVIAFVIPNLFRRLLGEGALSSAFLPVYSQYVETKPREEADRMASNIFCLTGLTLLAIIVVGGTGSLLWGMACEPGSKSHLISRLLLILLPYMFFICLTAVCQAVLNTHKHFLVPALAPLVLNIFWIVGLLIAGGGEGDTNDWRRIFIVAVSIILGGMVQLGMQVPALRRFGFKFTFRCSLQDPGFRRVLITLMPIVVGIGVLQINSVLDNVIAETLIAGDGAVSYLYYANRMLQFPLSIIGMALAVAAFPTFSAYFARGEIDKLNNELSKILQITFFIALPATIGLVAVSEPLVQLLFGHGKFMQAGGAQSIARESRVVMFYAFGVWAHCLVQVLTRAFFAVGDTKTPFRVAAYMVAFNFCLNLLLVGHMAEAGLALATTVSGTLVLLALLWRSRIQFGWRWNQTLRASSLRTLAGSLLMGGACWGVYHAIGAAQFQIWYGSLTGKLMALSVIFWTGVLVYAIWSWCLQRDMVKLLLRR